MDDNERTAMRKATVFITLGAEISGTVAGAALFGYWLDSRYSTAPLFILTLVLASSFAVFWRILRVVRRLDSRSDKELR